MTDDVARAPEQSPLMFYQGQPISSEAAVARMEQLRTDHAFQQRIAARDPEAFAEHTRLWRISRGMTPEPVMAVNTQDVLTQHSERAVAESEQRMELYLRKGFSADAAYEIINQRPIPFEERQIRERELARLRNDEAFMQRYRRGDRDAVLEHDSNVVAMSLPVARSLADIRAWQTAHNRPLSK